MAHDPLIYIFLFLLLILLIIINLLKILAETPIIELEESILTERVFTSKKEFLEEFVRLHRIDLNQGMMQTIHNAYTDYCNDAKERNVVLLYDYPAFAKYIRKYFTIDNNILDEPALLGYIDPKIYVNDNVGWEYEE